MLRIRGISTKVRGGLPEVSLYRESSNEIVTHSQIIVQQTSSSEDMPLQICRRYDADFEDYADSEDDANLKGDTLWKRGERRARRFSSGEHYLFSRRGWESG